MVKYTFKWIDLFRFTQYRYQKIMLFIIVAFGLFAIGSMFTGGAMLSILGVVFAFYVVGAFAFMHLLFAVVAMIQYRIGYKGRVYGYEIKKDTLFVYCDNERVYTNDLDALQMRRFKNLYIFEENKRVAGFFPESVRNTLVEN